MRKEGFYLGFIEEDTPMGWEHGCGRGTRKDGIALGFGVSDSRCGFT